MHQNCNLHQCVQIILSIHKEMEFCDYQFSHNLIIKVVKRLIGWKLQYDDFKCIHCFYSVFIELSSL